MASKKSLLVALVFVGTAVGCLREYDNTCGSHGDCCSGYCWRGNANWATGVCKQRDGGSGGGNPGQPGGRKALVTRSQLNQAVTSNGFPKPRHDQYNSFIRALSKAAIASKRDAAMILAQLLHESDGLREKQEIRCRHNQCQGEYGNQGCERPGKYYYGRGYIQLTWCYNYGDASHGLGLGDLLLQQPELVATNENYAWDTALWYWKERVLNGAYGNQVREGQFGASTRAINGMECGHGYDRRAKRRFEIYKNVHRAFVVGGEPDGRGCY